MSVLHDAMSHAVLGWVKPELDETLRQARGEIEAFVEDPADASRLRFCAGYLHQVQGTLRMVELYAPALIAEEMELLALAVQNGQVAGRDEACAALMHGMVSLPDYLERLQGGYREIPIVLLPLLNNIRSARGESALDESALFLPNLNRPLPIGVSQASSLSWAQRQARMGAAQSMLDNALAAWPENGVPGDFGGLIGSVTEWLNVAQYDSTRCMAWVLASVADALSNKAIEPAAGFRDAFLSAADALRQAHEEDGIPASKAGVPTQEPTRQLLYLVARSSQVYPALDVLRDTFDLGAWRPSEAELEHARSSLSGRNQELLATVGGVIKEDLLRVKDALDLLLRTDGDAASLEPRVAELTNIAETLGMVGMGTARDLVLHQRDTLRSVASGAQPATEEVLLEVAGALLQVDAALDGEIAQVAAPGEESGKDPGSIEAQRTIEVLVHEAIVNFTAAREHFVAFIETNWDHARLTEVPDLLNVVVGALRILELPTPAGYLEGVCRYIATELLEKRRVPSGRQLDTLADAMASLEYYLEALRDHRPNREEILDITRSSLESLHYWPLPEESVVVESSPVMDEVAAPSSDTAVPPPLTDSVLFPPPVAPVSPADEGQEPAAASELAIDAPVSEPVLMPEPVVEASEPVLASELVADVPEPVLMPEPVVEVSEPVLAPELVAEVPEPVLAPEPMGETSEPIDFSFEPIEDISGREPSVAVEIPVETQEVDMEKVNFIQPDSNTEVTTWRDLSAIFGTDSVESDVRVPPETAVPEAHDEESVTEYPVSADADAAVESTAETLSVVAESRDDLMTDAASEAPVVIAPAEEEVLASVVPEAAEQPLAPVEVAAPESVPEPPAVTTTDAVAFALPVAMFAFQEKEDIDDETREIFLEELEEETQNLSQLLPIWKADPQNIEKLRPVRRVFHTLKGSGRMVGASALGEFSWKIESMLNRVLESRRSASRAVIAMTEQAYELLPQLGAALRGEGSVTSNVPAMEEIAERIAAGEDVYYIPAEHAFVPAEETVAADVASPVEAAVVEPEETAPDEMEGVAVEVDGVLLEILEAEVANHLSTVRQWLDSVQSMTQEARMATDPLLRAVHTMNGAFAMAEVPAITTITGKTESYVRRLLANGSPAAEDGIVAIADAANAIERCVRILRKPASRIPHFEDLISRLEGLLASLPEACPPPRAAPRIGGNIVGRYGGFRGFRRRVRAAIRSGAAWNRWRWLDGCRGTSRGGRAGRRSGGKRRSVRGLVR